MRARAEPRPAYPSLTAWVTLSLALWSLTAGSADAADPPRAEAVIVEHLRGLGAEVPEPAVRVFLQQGESIVRSDGAGPGCTGFLAFGSGSVRDVDLSLMAEGGLVLDEDSLVAPFAYVRACPAESMPVFVSVSLYAGRGELLLLRVKNAPPSVGLLPMELDLAAASGGRAERPRAVGPGPPPLTQADRLEAADREWLQRGYVASGGQRVVAMGGGLSSSALPLERGLCYAVIVRSEPSRQTAIAVADAAGRRWAGTSKGPEAVTYVCPESTEEHPVLLRADPGGPRAFVRAFVQMDAGRQSLPPGAADRARAWAGEVTGHFEARGLSTHPLGEGWVDTVGELHWPVQLTAGHCYAHAAVVLADTSRASLELALEAPDGELLARHRARDGWPRVFHCAAVTGTYQLVLEAQAEVGRVVILQGERAIGGESGGDHGS